MAKTFFAAIPAAFLVLAPAAVLFVLLCRALLAYIRSAEVRREKNAVKASLGEVLRKYRTGRGMPQEFVAESLGVSRQAVRKWEQGVSDPGTSNLLAMAKLFGASAEELPEEVGQVRPHRVTSGPGRPRAGPPR